ncbi:hypothetical protein BUC_6178 [Burkholderia pseudomallei 576]|nr:hypothetical protein BUC_6178 [Burkholderia pseudomallei 576]
MRNVNAAPLAARRASLSRDPAFRAASSHRSRRMRRPRSTTNDRAPQAAPIFGNN